MINSPMTPGTQLALDVGNSSLKAGIFDDGLLRGEPVRLAADDWPAVSALATNHGAQSIIYSTVANEPPLHLLDDWHRRGLTVLRLTAGLPLPFTSLYGTMDTIGVDRLAAVAGATTLGEFPCSASIPPAPAVAQKSAAYLIVDAGSCATLDLLGADAVYHGGNISPGIRMRLRAMHAFTARLPEPSLEDPAGTVGTSTEDALRHGAGLGLVYEIEGLWRRLREFHPGLRIVLTGGDAAWISARLTVEHELCPHLVLRGLIQILSNYVSNRT